MSDQPTATQKEKVLGDCSGVYIPCEGKKPEMAIDFGGFIVGLYQSALMSLGRMAHPETQKTQIDLTEARHTIDILCMLKQKTEGNLESEEASLIKGLLQELKLAYVEASK